VLVLSSDVSVREFVVVSEFACVREFVNVGVVIKRISGHVHIKCFTDSHIVAPA